MRLKTCDFKVPDTLKEALTTKLGPYKLLQNESGVYIQVCLLLQSLSYHYRMIKLKT